MSAVTPALTEPVTVRPMRAADAETADRIMREAFGTFLGLPEPGAFMGDASLVLPRARMLEDGAWVAERDGEVVGSTFATRWGGFGYFGPLSVRPDLWGRGIARRLMEPVEEAFAAWGVTARGLFTWPHSPQHLALYQGYGFWPHALTAIVAGAARPGGSAAYEAVGGGDSGAERALAACREVAGAVHEGLDLSEEAEATLRHGLGEVVLVDGGFAICQHGAGTEGGGGALYVKFGAVTPGAGAEGRFRRLLDACEDRAARVGAQAVVAGVSTARLEAYRALLARGYRIEIQGIAMHGDGEPLWSRRGCWVLDDWR